MNNIRDLQYEKEIVPLFDFVYNEFSREVLIGLISEIPASIDEVLCRQQIIREMMVTDSLSPTFFYSKSEFNEIYSFIEYLKNKPQDLQGMSLRLHLFFSKAELSSLGSRLTQLVSFFGKIDKFYFSYLEAEKFPDLFGRRIQSAKLFILNLEISKYQSIVQKRSLKISEIIKLTAVLREKIRDGEMDVFLNSFFLFEAYLSISKGIKKHNFIFPVFNNERFSISNFYHPALKSPVKNSLTAKGNVTCITGPNMSGKSTLLKAIGICVFLAHVGLAVPAEQCELPFFDLICVSINLTDDLKKGLSHFMTEMKSLKEVVLTAHDGKKCFAVFDELFRGTNTDDAIEISKTTILGLTKFSDSWFFVSTHLHQLNETITLNKDKIDVRHIECILENNNAVFTYKLLDGWSDLKIGRLLFDQEGLNLLLNK